MASRIRSYNDSEQQIVSIIVSDNIQIISNENNITSTSRNKADPLWTLAVYLQRRVQARCALFVQEHVTNERACLQHDPQTTEPW